MSGCAYCGSLEPLVAEKDGFRSETSICVWGGRWCLRTRAFLDGAEVSGTFIPINYCPFCGRSMRDVTLADLWLGHCWRHGRTWHERCKAGLGLLAEREGEEGR